MTPPVNPESSTDEIAAAETALDAHVREIIAWHFSHETGTPFWLDWAQQTGAQPVEQVRSFADLARLPRFEDAWLRDERHDRWVPRAYESRPFKIFETGGTTGLPKQRISWEDHLIDYADFSDTLDRHYPDAFPRGAHWLMLGPTGPRRLRVAVEHLANLRGGSCYFVDLDPRWVRKMASDRQSQSARDYMKHVIDQAKLILGHRDIGCLFATPRLLEALGERIDVPDAGIRAVFCGGTSMTPQVIRFLVEEVLQRRAVLVPTYGNTLMGLAVGKPVSADDGYALTYYAPQPRAVLRVVDPEDPDRQVDYDQWGRIELTTLTRELFMPRFLERDEAVRRPPGAGFFWDGTGDVRPLGSAEKTTVEGVY